MLAWARGCWRCGWPGTCRPGSCAADGGRRRRLGAAWAAIPEYLQAYRGSHIVITTIMFNFIANKPPRVPAGSTCSGARRHGGGERAFAPRRTCPRRRMRSPPRRRVAFLALNVSFPRARPAPPSTRTCGAQRAGYRLRTVVECGAADYAGSAPRTNDDRDAISARSPCSWA